jgi:hypothetical protein
VSGVFQNIDPHPLSPQRVCPPPAPKAGGTHLPGGDGERVGVNILEDARHWIGLLQYNLSAVQVIAWTPPAKRDVGQSMDASYIRDASHSRHFSNRKYGSDSDQTTFGRDACKASETPTGQQLQ